MHKILVGVAVCAGLATGNFLFQFAFSSTPNIHDAIEQTFFQVVAVAIALWLV